jgi:c-di-GMP-binding flagellar brake protein YcgR
VTTQYHLEKRQFVRVPKTLSVSYRLTGVSGEDVGSDTLTGETENISAGGMLLKGHLPDPNVITELLMRRVVLLVRMELPDVDHTVTALARVSWLDSIDVESGLFSLGLEYKEITKEAQDKIIAFILRGMQP